MSSSAHAASPASLGFALNQPPLVGEIIDGEVMIINLESGVYYNITGAGALAWPWLIGKASLDDIAGAIARHFAADATVVARDLALFAERLLAEAIVRREGATLPLSPPALAAGATATYSGFGFERYDDMRALLVVDPVHEVGDFGWPPRPESAPKTT